MVNKPKIIFLLASISQPRCLKRIRGFIDQGFEIEIYGFDRGVYNINSTIDNHKINSLGPAPSGSGYFQKFFTASKKLKSIFNKERNPKTLYYCFSFDIALVCLFSKKKYIYEISDLVYGYFKNKLVRRGFRIIDRKLITKSILTVMTSQGFYDYIFPKKSLKNIIIQPNRIDSFFSKNKRFNKDVDPNAIIFSYIGAFRYPNTVFRFAKVIGEKYPEHSFMFFGDSILTSQVKELADKYENVKYFGEFKNPDDLPGIYAQIDLVVACYDILTLNERIAEPNKLYESMFFNKPIVVSKGTFLEIQVIDKYKCGYAIDATADDNICKFIDSLDQYSMKMMIDRIEKINTNEIIDDKSLKIIEFILNN